MGQTSGSRSFTSRISDRRPTYVLDTPCLTRNYMIRYGDHYDLTRSSNKHIRAEKFREIINKINSYIRALHGDDLKGSVASGEPVEYFSNTLSLPPVKQPDQDKKTEKHWLQTVFGALKIKNTPVEYFFDMHSEYFTVQFRAYPNAGYYMQQMATAEGLPEETNKSIYMTQTAKILQMLSLPRGKAYQELIWPTNWSPEKGIASHDLFRELCSSSSKDNKFESPETDEVSLGDLGMEMPLEAVSRLLYDEFWYDLFESPKNNENEIGLSPKRYFENISIDDPSTSQEQVSGIITRLPFLKRVSKSDAKTAFETKAIFKGVIIRPVAETDVTLANEANDRSKTSNEVTAEALFKNQIKDLVLTLSGLPTPDAGERLESRRIKQLFDTKFVQKDASPNKVINGELRFLKNHLNGFSEIVSRILGYRVSLDKYGDHNGGNVVLCGALDGLALFGSRFGKDTTANKDKPEARYFIFYRGASRNQLARFNRRLNAAAEARIMSTLDFESVRQAGDSLRRIDAELDDPDQALDAATLSELQKWTADTERNIVRSGLRHRTVRSEYYKDRLDRLVKDLRITRLVGWQTYDEYILRVYDPPNAASKRILARLKSVEAKLSIADDRQQTRTTTKLTRAAIGLGGLTALALVQTGLKSLGPNSKYLIMLSNFWSIIIVSIGMTAIVLLPFIWFDQCSNRASKVRRQRRHELEPLTEPSKGETLSN